jgi:hypothetical protein
VVLGKIRNFWILLLIPFLVLAEARIDHIPPAQAGVNTPLVLQLRIQSATDEVEEVLIFYRSFGDREYSSVEMYPDLDLYRGTIPGHSLGVQGLEYLILVKFKNNAQLSFPELQPYLNPVFVPVRNGISKERESSGPISNALVLAPELGEQLEADDLVIAISLYGVTDLDYQRIELFLDDVSIRSEAEVSSDLIVVRPRRIPSGRHYFEVRLFNQAGLAYQPLRGTFEIKSASNVPEPLQYSGRFSAISSSEQVRGERLNLHSLRTNADFHYGRTRVGLSTFFTSQENRQRQPRDRYQAALRIPHLQLEIGDVYPRFTEFGLRGKRVRGFNGILEFRYVNLQLVAGQTERALPGTIVLNPDTLSNGLLSYPLLNYSFERRLYGIRPYFGDGRRFQLGFSLLKSIDDTLSLKYQSGDLPSDRDFVLAGTVTPKDNLLLGTDCIITFNERRIIWENDLSTSLLNRDISNGAISLKQMDTFSFADTTVNDTISFGEYEIPIRNFPIDPEQISDLIIINQNLQPLSPVVPDSTGRFHLKDFFSMPSLAVKSALTLNYLDNYVVLKYFRVGPKYASLSNPYQRTDIRGFSISDRIRLIGNKILVNLSYEQTQDNLNKAKAFITTASSFSGGFSFYLGAGLPVINLSTRQYSYSNDVSRLDTTYYFNPYIPSTPDSVKISDQRENNVTLSRNFRISHSVNLFGIRNQLILYMGVLEKSDRVNNRLNGFQLGEFSNSVFRISINSQFGFPLRTNIYFSSNQNTYLVQSSSVDIRDIGIEGQYQLWQGHLLLLSGYRFTEAAGIFDYIQNNLYFLADLRIAEKHLFRMRLSYSYIKDDVINGRYQDVSWMINYSLVI